MVMRGLRVPFAKRLYIVRDCKREAERLGLPFGRICDPLGPGIARAMALFHHAEKHGAGLAFIRSAARGSWGEALDLASDDDMQTITTRAGLAWADAASKLDDTSWKASAEANRVALSELGLWGVPSLAVAGLSSWGQDRIAWIDERLSAG
jgi:2-hydroxychromene-2-carboxylate isomerase